MGTISPGSEAVSEPSSPSSTPHSISRAAHIFLDQDLAVMPERLGDRLREFLRRPRLADADRRAETRRLDEHRTAELGVDRLKGRRVALDEA